MTGFELRTSDREATALPTEPQPTIALLSQLVRMATLLSLTTYAEERGYPRTLASISIYHLDRYIHSSKDTYIQCYQMME